MSQARLDTVTHNRILVCIEAIFPEHIPPAVGSKVQVTLVHQVRIEWLFVLRALVQVDAVDFAFIVTSDTRYN